MTSTSSRGLLAQYPSMSPIARGLGGVGGLGGLGRLLIVGTMATATLTATVGCNKDPKPGEGSASGPTTAQPATREDPAQDPAQDSAEAPQEAQDPQEAALKRAEEAATDLVAKLKGELMKAMSNGGPKSALEVCTAQGQSLTQGVADASGVQVGRSSLRLRNPKNAPPAWVATWLAEQGERKVDGAPSIVPMREVVDTPDGKVARIVKPIPVEPPCLKCHGASDSLAPEITESLRTHYPEDKATGYAVGDLRGALWAQAPVEGS